MGEALELRARGTQGPNAADSPAEAQGLILQAEMLALLVRTVENARNLFCTVKKCKEFVLWRPVNASFTFDQVGLLRDKGRVVRAFNRKRPRGALSSCRFGTHQHPARFAG